MSEIRIHKIKFLITLAIAPIVLMVAFKAYTGSALPWLPIVFISILAAIGFALFSLLFSQYFLVVIIDEPFIWNRSKALGKGKVDLKEAKRVFSLDIFFIVLKDRNKSIARIPKPFWAEDPVIIKKLLKNMNQNIV